MLNEAVKLMTALYKLSTQPMHRSPRSILSSPRKIIASSRSTPSWNFDDNAMFRHKDLKELRDITEEDPLEVELPSTLNYIKLDAT